MDNVKLFTWLGFIAILISPFVLQPWIEAHIHRSSLIEKHGRLVDIRTSAPLANATVILHWYRTEQHAGCMAQRATTTDANGEFVLPDISPDVSFSRSWLGAIVGTVTMYGYYTASYEYSITVYAPGSALVAPRRTAANPPDLAYWLTDPPGREVRGAIELDPIRVTPTSFTPADEIAYLARLKNALTCDWPGRTEPVEVTKARAEIVARMRPLPCAMPPQTMVKASLVAEYVIAAGGRRIEEALAPPGARLGPMAWQRDLRAEELCRAVSK